MSNFSFSLRANDTPLIAPGATQGERTWPVKVLIASALAYAVLLGLTLSGWSLWTDEAFSAYIADHSSLRTLLATLYSGDSSDLQMIGYYVYLHGWSRIFGDSEIALRASNGPFFLLFSGVLVWSSWRIFRSRWLWIVPSLFPFIWFYASQLRPYFAVFTLSFVAFTVLFTNLSSPSERERRLGPWLILGCLFVGALFHMLMLLSAVPLVIVGLWGARSHSELGGLWAYWRKPCFFWAAPFVAIGGYLAWTFGRGVQYDYVQPNLRSWVAVIYRFLGLLGYGPNRRFDIPFQPYLVEMTVAGLAVLTALGGLYFLSVKQRKSALGVPVAFALLASIAIAGGLGIVVHQQLDSRHLAAITPLLLFAPLIAWQEAGRLRGAGLLLSMLALTWFISDTKILFSPQYKGEDFRKAVAVAQDLQQSSGASLALVADPAAVSYYGLRVSGPAPCFPITRDCGSGFAKVPWLTTSNAALATFWTEQQITEWIQKQSQTKAAVLVLISQHPAKDPNPWWSVISHWPHAQCFPVLGFCVYSLPLRSPNGDNEPASSPVVSGNSHLELSSFTRTSKAVRGVSICRNLYYREKIDSFFRSQLERWFPFFQFAARPFWSR